MRIVLCLLLLCAAPLGLFLLVGWVNGVHYWAVTNPLGSEDETVRDDAIKTMRGGGPETAFHLGRALRNDSNPYVREGAARALAEFDQATLDSGYDPISDLRAAAGSDADATVREAAKAAFEKLDGR